MRTTLTIDDDVLALARSLAEARKISVGEAVSYLARRGAAARGASALRQGFHVFVLDRETPRFGPEEVAAALDAEDNESAPEFTKQD